MNNIAQKESDEIIQKKNEIFEATKLNNITEDLSSKIILSQLKQELEELLKQKVEFPVQ